MKEKCFIINLFKLFFLRGSSKTTSLKFLFIRFFKTSTCFGKLQLKWLRWNRASVIFQHPSRLYFPSLIDGSGKTSFYPELSNISRECIFLYWSPKTSSILPSKSFCSPGSLSDLTCNHSPWLWHRLHWPLCSCLRACALSVPFDLKAPPSSSYKVRSLPALGLCSSVTLSGIPPLTTYLNYPILSTLYPTSLIYCFP